MSKLDLAIAAGTTARHVSFVETGWSRPGKELILRIGAALRVPLPERNTLLAAAGFPPSFPAHEMGSQAMEPVNRVLTAVLRRHEPHPAWVVRQPFTFRQANAGAEALFPGLTALSPEQLIDLWFGPGPFRDQVINWAEVAQAGLDALRDTAADTGDDEALGLLRRAEAHARDCLAMPAPDTGSSPVVCPVFTFRCRETACGVMSRWPAMSPTGRGPRATSWRMARRCGSASALRAASGFTAPGRGRRPAAASRGRRGRRERPGRSAARGCLL